MATFPTSIPSYTGFTSTHTLAADNHAAQHNSEQGDIVAVATKIGTGSSTPTSGMLLRGTGSGTSSWAQVNLTSDITGVLPIANGGTGTTSTTGTGSVVYGTAPTVSNPTVTGTVSGSATYITPTISDFTNANHNHQNTTGGGTLNAANALQAGTVNFANLLSTIFSGQVQSQTNAGTSGGTMYYINLGGIKLLWMSTSSATTGATTYTVTFPTSFFNTIQTIVPGNVGSAGTTTGLYIVTGSASSTGFQYYSGTNPQNAFFLVIGT